MTRCVSCGASNPDAAEWCGLCLSVLAHGPDPVPGQATASAPAAPAPPARASSPPQAAGEGGEAARRGFRRREGHVEWTCPTCGHAVSVEEARCPACATSMATRFGPSVERRQPTITPQGALALTAVLPGAGHIAHRSYGSGVARVLLFALWLVGGVVIGAGPGTGSFAVAMPLLLGAAVLWLGSLADVLALHAGGRQLIEGRTLLWLVVGVTALTLVGAVAATGAVMALS